MLFYEVKHASDELKANIIKASGGSELPEQRILLRCREKPEPIAASHHADSDRHNFGATS